MNELHVLGYACLSSDFSEHVLQIQHVLHTRAAVSTDPPCLRTPITELYATQARYMAAAPIAFDKMVARGAPSPALLLAELQHYVIQLVCACLAGVGSVLAASACQHVAEMRSAGKQYWRSLPCAAEEGGTAGDVAVDAVLSGELLALPLEEPAQGLVEVLSYVLKFDRLLAAFRGEERLVVGRVLEHAPEASDIEVVPTGCIYDGTINLVSTDDARWERLGLW